jgi:eukaryotic-like serine/threonine-protein kinase
MREVPAQKIGRYEIIRVLGRGSTGEVILARDENLGRLIAIKRAVPCAQVQELTGIRVDAKAAALRHPNIPVIYEMSGNDEPPFLAMEYVEGETLEKIIDSKPDLDLITRLRIIEQVCSALGYAHKNGIIHLNIKPANIIVRPDGTAKITDFGIARPTESELSSRPTRVSRIASLGYKAPESVHGSKVDGRADIFSAGMTLFKVLTGKEPITTSDGSALLKTSNALDNGRDAYLQDFSQVLQQIVEKAVARNPDARYQTGEDFAAALHQVIEELKRSRVLGLLSGAEELTTAGRFASALELLDEAIKLDPADARARKLRNFAREHEERIRRGERLRACFLKSEEALQRGNFESALNHLRDARSLDAASEEVKARIEAVESQKIRFENSTRALTDAEHAKVHGDLTGARRIVSAALKEDPGNKPLRLWKSALQREMERDAERGRLVELHEEATRALAVREYTKAEMLLSEAGGIDPTNATTQKLGRQLCEARELEQRQAALDEVQQQVEEFIRVDNYESAAELLNRALDRFPTERRLHRLRAEVDSEASKYDVKHIIELTIMHAQELFLSSPFEALNMVRTALENMPGEIQLMSCERSLRQQIKGSPSDKIHSDTVLQVRELIDARQFERAIGILETYQSEAGQRPDINALLLTARSEWARRQRGDIIEAVSRS